MADLRLSGRNIGVVRNFDMKLSKLTLLSGECGSGKSTILKALCYLTEGGERIDEVVFENLLSFYADLSDRVESRLKESDLPDEEKKDLTEKIWDEGIEPYMAEFLKKGLVTKEEFASHTDIISHNYFHYEDGDDRWLSDITREEIENTVDMEFPYIAECGTDGEREMRLEGFRMEDADEDEAEVRLTSDCLLESAKLPYAPESIYLSNVPVVDSGLSLDDDALGYRPIAEKAWWKVVEEEAGDGDESDEEEAAEEAEDFQDKLETALERFLGDTVRGFFEYDEDEDEFTFYRDSDGEGFDLDCMPPSYRAVADLALLIRRRAIKDYTILVVDGLEQTMSPEWKTCLAEFLVGLSRLGNVRVVVSSMSSEFLEAIAYFADEYLEDDQFRCYMTEFEEDWTSHVIDCTDDFEPLYEFLNGPVPDDEDEEEDIYEDDGEEVDDYFSDRD